jgi:Putative transposase DNA-binding domain
MAKSSSRKVQVQADVSPLLEESASLRHEPQDDAYASFRLELRRPVLQGDEASTRAWQEIHSVRRLVGQAVQRGIGDIVVHVRNLRAAGKTRFPNPSERANSKLGIPLPVECYDQDMTSLQVLFKDYLEEALKQTGISEYVYSSVSRKIAASEFSGDKMRALLRGEASYPVLRNVAISMRNRNWRLYMEPKIVEGKECLDIVVEISALRPHLGRMRLICQRLTGSRLGRAKALLSALEALGYKPNYAEKKAGGWEKGALMLKPVQRPGQMLKWFIILPYVAPRSVVGESKLTMAIHRSVTNMLTAATSKGEVNYFPGHDVVKLKHQMHARRRLLAQELASMPHRGRGTRHHHKALARLSDAERRATDTNLWRAARWVQNVVEASGASIVLLDDFTSFNPDLPGPPFEAYVRTFPLSDLKLKVIDALTRRAGVTVEERSSVYISQRCPDCGTVSQRNVEKMPSVKGIVIEKGWFKCIKCKFSGNIDKIAALNLLDHWTKPISGTENLSLSR